MKAAAAYLRQPLSKRELYFQMLGSCYCYVKSVEWLPIYRYTGNDAGGIKIFLNLWELFPFLFGKTCWKIYLEKSIFEKVSESLRYEGF